MHVPMRPCVLCGLVQDRPTCKDCKRQLAAHRQAGWLVALFILSVVVAIVYNAIQAAR